MKKQITRLFTCAMFILDKVTEKELLETFTKDEIKYSKAIINYIQLRDGILL